MFGPNKLAKVNANPIGGYRAETLLAAESGLAWARSVSWNLLLDASGQLWEAWRGPGRPLYDLVEFTPDDLAGVIIEGAAPDFPEPPSSRPGEATAGPQPTAEFAPPRRGTRDGSEPTEATYVGTESLFDDCR